MESHRAEKGFITGGGNSKNLTEMARRDAKFAHVQENDALTLRPLPLKSRAMATKLTDQLVDKRLIRRNLVKGLLDKDTLDAHLSSLKDMADNAEAVPYVDPEPEPEVEVEGEENAEGIEATARDEASLTPLASTPLASTPLASTPLAATPLAATPVAATPVAATPVDATPVDATPVAESTTVETAATETPIEGA